MIGTQLDSYHIQVKIGQGGMADVYKAYQVNLDRFVAIKVLRSGITAANNPFVKYFEVEAKTIAKLEHPYILPIYDFGLHHGTPYIVTRYIENGVTLHHYITEPLQPEQTLKYIVPIGQALAYAHQHQIVHRDVKPSNILMDGARPLLADFGLAKAYANSIDWRKSTTISGTPAYMSPEQFNGTQIDGRSDMYALGLILYQMITGQIPHQANTLHTTMYKRNTIPPVSPQIYNPHISDTFAQVVLKVLATKADDRFTDMVAFNAALQNAVDTSTSVIATAKPKSQNQNLSTFVWLFLSLTTPLILVLFWLQGRTTYSVQPPSPLTLSVTKSTNTIIITPWSTRIITGSAATATASSMPPTDTATHTSPIATATATAMQAALPTALPSPTNRPQPTQTAILTPFSTITTGTIMPLSPTNETTTGVTTFQWEWSGSQLPSDFGFEVSVWQEDEPRTGAHDAIADNLEGRITLQAENIYQFTTNISNAYGVQNRPGSYIWAVSIVKIHPTYDPLADKFLSHSTPIQFALSGGNNSGNSNNEATGDNTGWIE